MGTAKNVLTSTVTRKYVMALTGLGLTAFIVAHLIGNLQLLLPDQGAAFNTYAHHLESFGKLLWVAEGGLLLMFLAHIAFAVLVNKDNSAARATGYSVEATKGGASNNNFSSRNMLVLGAVIAVFVVFHVIHFKFGAYYETMLAGPPEIKARNLYRLVVEEFKKPHIVAFYVGAMFFLMFHLRHGLWSMFQSLGAMPRKWSVPAYAVGGVVAVILAVGFMLLPIIIFLMPDAMLGLGGAK